MSLVYRTLIRPVLFSQESEAIHDRILRTLSWASRQGILRRALESLYASPQLPQHLFGLDFPNPVGLAAGMDKQAQALPAWESLGFGFCELGGVTWHPQPGNEKPRMFRAPASQALVNRMGFNNPGAKQLASTLSAWRKSGLWPGHPVGINLGKSKITPLAEAAEDYAKSFKALHDSADFFVVNVSSPNTPNLRRLQDKDALNDILAAMQEVNEAATPARSDSPGPPAAKPVLIKVAPDLEWNALDEILEVAALRKVAGLVATNTTIARPETADPKLKAVYTESGGLSGAPLRLRSTEVIRHLYRQSDGRIPIIGVGGIFSSIDAWEKITAGASLVQVYTGFVYEGPGLIREIVANLRKRMAREGLDRLEQAVGIDSRPARKD